MFLCHLCEKETVYFSNLCTKCRKIKHLINLYGDEVYLVLDEVLVRDRVKQQHKIKKIISSGVDKNEKQDLTKSVNLYSNVTKGTIK